jgi:CheY-like chemotaxis protein
MRILLVEDDEFKAADIAKVIVESLPDALVCRAMSVTSALRAITNDNFSLVILDMSLPTFDLSGQGGGGSPQSQGGVEVLRLAKRLGRQPPFIVVTQYPDIEVDRRDIPLAQAPKVLRARFGLEIRGCLKYEFGGDAWKLPLRAHLSMSNKSG